MIRRPGYLNRVRRGLAANPIVSVLGPRQVGKSTLAREIAQERENAHFLDLENPVDASRLSEPMTALEPLTVLVVIDEVQRQPELFALLLARGDLALERVLIVTPGRRSYPLADWAEVVAIPDLLARLEEIRPT